MSELPCVPRMVLVHCTWLVASLPVKAPGNKKSEQAIALFTSLASVKWFRSKVCLCIAEIYRRGVKPHRYIYIFFFFSKPNRGRRRLGPAESS